MQPFDFALVNWVTKWMPLAQVSLGASAMFAPTAEDLDLPGGHELFNLQTPRPTAAIASIHGVSSTDVMLTCGATEADFLAGFALLQAGDTVLVERPTYPPLVLIAESMGARVERFDRPFGDGFSADPDALCARIARGDVRLVCFTSPNNPTGRCVDPAVLAAVGDACEAAGAWILVDEIFRELIVDQPSAAALHPRCISTSSLTKCYGVNRVRFGWAVNTGGALDAMRKAQTLTTFNPSFVDAGIAACALQRREHLLTRNAASAWRNFELLQAFVDARPGLDVVRPHSPVICAVRLPEGTDDLAFCERLLTEQATLLYPGSLMDLPGFVRVGCGLPSRAFDDGLARFGALLDSAHAPSRP